MPRIRIDRTYEPHETAFVQRVLKPGQTFVDVGAHIGYYSVMAAKLVGAGGRVYAFEPDPTNAAELRQNVEPFSDIVMVHELSIADCPGQDFLYLSTENPGDHRLYATEGRTAIGVGVTTLDLELYFGNIPSADFIKIDVQGCEVCVLKGARQFFTNSPDIKGIIELSPEHLKAAGSSAAELVGLLVEIGFNLFHRESRRIDPSKYAALGKRKNPMNLLFSREETL